jgi:hypothetical protein
MQGLESTKLFFVETGLFQNLAEGSRRQCAGMHGYIGLPSVRMA